MRIRTSALLRLHASLCAVTLVVQVSSAHVYIEGWCGCERVVIMHGIIIALAHAVAGEGAQLAGSHSATRWEQLQNTETCR